jgi:hypothetical protein
MPFLPINTFGSYSLVNTQARKAHKTQKPIHIDSSTQYYLSCKGHSIKGLCTPKNAIPHFKTLVTSILRSYLHILLSVYIAKTFAKRTTITDIRNISTSTSSQSIYLSYQGAINKRPIYPIKAPL